jgi:biopolymer transport protein ExbD
MGRAKLPRKSTSIDMTAMCDVAFLLLSFFILTTKFKPDEALAVQTPNSVSTTTAEDKNICMVTIDKDGKVFLSFSEDAPKREVIENINTSRQLGLTEQEMARFAKLDFVGASLGQMKSVLNKSAEELKSINYPGIPVLDTANNEMKPWMTAVFNAFQNRRITLLLKGDNMSKFPSVNAVIDAFKANDFLKFQMVTNPEGAPPGTELARKQQGGDFKEE